MGWYPSWLYESIFKDDLPWDLSSKTLPDFQEQFTLHDSTWIGLYQDVAYYNSLTLIIDWDVVWLPEVIKNQIISKTESLFLMIKLSEVKQVTISDYQNIGEIQRGITSAELITKDGVNQFILEDHYGGVVKIEFVGTSSILALTEDKKVMPI